MPQLGAGWPAAQGRREPNNPPMPSAGRGYRMLDGIPTATTACWRGDNEGTKKAHGYGVVGMLLFHIGMVRMSVSLPPASIVRDDDHAG
jgi:hypothetical protein